MNQVETKFCFSNDLEQVAAVSLTTAEEELLATASSRFVLVLQNWVCHGMSTILHNQRTIKLSCYHAGLMGLACGFWRVRLEFFYGWICVGF